jgi:iron complex outermembrane recepter protein
MNSPDLGCGSVLELGRCSVRLARSGTLALAGLVVAITAVAGEVSPAADSYDPNALKKLSFEDLMTVEVTTASRQQQQLDRTPAAVYVITREEIERSGVRSIPEALRLAPGVEVAHISAYRWAISIRGFNSDIANKLLVLIDGRSVYTPLYSGVFWDVQDVLLADVERIEVIAGPAGTLWGANAVNGVINVITRNAGDTQGGYASVGAGSEERVAAAVRYGGELGHGVRARAYVKYFDRDPSSLAGGEGAFDAWRMARGGFRLDRGGERDAFTLEGDLYDGEEGSQFSEVAADSTTPGPVMRGDSQLRGGNLLAGWTRQLEGDADLQLRAYYDRTERLAIGSLRENRDTIDLDFQYRATPGRRHEIVWGAGYRVTRDALENSFSVAFEPDHRTDDLFSAFLQDAITLSPDRLYLTVGTKVEHNDYTGLEVQPNVRLAFQIDDRQTVWAAVSRAVRTPSRLDSDLVLSVPITLPQVPLPILVVVRGDADFQAEELVAWEAGYRSSPVPGLSLDLVAFYHEYDRLQSQEADLPIIEVESGFPRIVLPNHLANGLRGSAYGSTLAVGWLARPSWKLQLAYSHLDLDIRSTPQSVDVSTPGSVAGSSPESLASLQSYLDLPAGWRLFAAARFVDALPARGVEGYLTADVRLSWSPRPGFSISLLGHDLLDDRHVEFGGDPVLEVERGFVAAASWRF